MPKSSDRATLAICRGAALAIGLLAMLNARFLAGQARIVVTVNDSPANDQSQPFLLGVVHNEVLEEIQNFERYCQKSEWEKAFKELEKIAAAPATGLVPAKDGIMVPRSMLLQQLLSGLPEEGKKAYRLFNDAEAKKLLQQALGADEIEKLNTVATQYLFTSSGDVAADRLGDLYFERGDFARAVRAWRSILAQRPDSDIPPPQLLVKISLALAHEARWKEFQVIRQQLRDRYASAQVTLGGRGVAAIDVLDKISPANSESTTAAATEEPVNVQLNADSKPLWQFRWFPLDDPAGGDRSGLMAYDQMYGQRYQSDFVPPVTADGARAYSNMAGYDVAIDLESGKLLWRSGRFFDLLQKMGQGMNPFLEQSGNLCGADRVWSVTRDPSAQNDYHFRLVARDVSSGKQLKDFRDWAVMGSPVADDSHLYVAAYKASQSNELHVLALNRADSKVVWDARIGTYKVDPRQQPYSIGRSVVPALLLARGFLYVDTNSGSLAQLSTSSGEVLWGLNYDCETPGVDRFYGQSPERCTTSAPLMVDGVLYIKGMRSRRLYAVDPDGPKVLWNRAVSRDGVLCGVDKERAYLGGEEITAYDLKTRQLLWSKPTPMGTSWVRPLMTADRIYQFTPRGIYEIEKIKGDVLQIFRGADMNSLGGSLLITPHALLAISNLAITAYPLGSTAESKTITDAKGDQPNR